MAHPGIPEMLCLYGVDCDGGVTNGVTKAFRLWRHYCAWCHIIRKFSEHYHFLEACIYHYLHSHRHHAFALNEFCMKKMSLQLIRNYAFYLANTFSPSPTFTCVFALNTITKKRIVTERHDRVFVILVPNVLFFLEASLVIPATLTQKYAFRDTFKITYVNALAKPS